MEPLLEYEEKTEHKRHSDHIRLEDEIDSEQDEITHQGTDAQIALPGDFRHLQSKAHEKLIKDAREKLIKLSTRKKLKTNIVSKSFAYGFFDENGGHLSIPEANVDMFIPPQAIKKGPQEVYIYLERNPSCDDIVMLGPVLHCGPHGLKFDAQVIFSLPINTSKPVDKWTLVPMRTETDIEKPTNWTPISETADALCFTEGNICTFFVDHFTGYGASCTSNDAVHHDQVFLIGAFSSPSEHTRGQFNFHIKCWKSDLQLTRLIHSTEEGQHCQSLGTAAIHIYPNRADLHLEIEDVSPGWTQDSEACSRVAVPYAGLMSDLKSSRTVQIEFGFKINSSAAAQPFACRIIAYQLPHQQERAELHVSSPDSPEMLQEQMREEQLLAPQVFNNICKLLDSESIRQAQDPDAKGWKSFAEQVGLPPGFIPNLMSRIESNEERRAGATPLGAASAAAEAEATTRQVRGPTATILWWWELQNKRKGLQAIQTLRDTFRSLGRLDVCSILDDAIEGQNQHFEEYPGVDTSRCLIRYHTQLSPVQEGSSGQAGTREETTVLADCVQPEAVHDHTLQPAPDLEQTLDTILSRLKGTDVRLLMRVWSARTGKQGGHVTGADMMKDMMKSEYITTGDLGMLQKDLMAVGISFSAIARGIAGVSDELKYPRTTEAAVGPAGGELEIPFFCKLIVPPEVLQQDTMIRISTVDVAAILRDPESANWLSGYPWSLGEDACPRELLEQVLFSPAVDVNIHGAQLNGPMKVQTWRPPGSEGMKCLLLKHHDVEGWIDITASTKHRIDLDRLSISLQNFCIIAILWFPVDIVIKVTDIVKTFLAGFSSRTLNCPWFAAYMKPMADDVQFHVVCRDQSVETDEYLPGFIKCGSNEAVFDLYNGNLLDISVLVYGGQSKTQPVELNSKQCCNQTGQKVQMLLNRPNGQRVKGEVDVKKVEVPTYRLACHLIFQEEGDISPSMSTRWDRADTDATKVEICFEKVVPNVSAKWDDLARELGFSRNQIKGIKLLEPDNDHRCREMLHRWRNREGRKATLQVLKEALINIEERLTAEIL